MQITENPAIYIPAEYRTDARVMTLAQELQQLEQQLAASRATADQQQYLSLYNAVNRKQFQLLELLSQPLT